MAESTFTVFAWDLARGEESRQKVGDFSTFDEASHVMRQRVLSNLTTLYEQWGADMGAKELFDLWTVQGEGVTILPQPQYSTVTATDLARVRSVEITGDKSRPLLLDVTCTDRLNFMGGFSPSQQWSFFVKAPATYSGADHLIRRAADLLYEHMSQQAYEMDGSGYTLVNLQVREITEDEMQEGKQSSPGKLTYTIQNDGAFSDPE